ncbi:MAG: hypothetical protein IPN29_05045 [Saprospiraceae bacterium]|nr:hypothetical protein [Saprospiraceae bacterium]
MKFSPDTKTLLFFHGIFSLLEGGFLLLMPVWLAGPSPNNEIYGLIRTMAIMAFAVGGSGFVLYKVFVYVDTFRKLMLFFMAYHLVMGLHLHQLASSSSLSTSWVSWLHFVMTFVFLWVYFNKKNRFEADNLSEE